ncbi:ATP-binding protein [Ancylomarina sp. 16SWW S1-10-2]|uniref:sensor histidine kinase n=1 Tax=Ancylomarina sp. 16SWW S1-10-2 TaxID=2499681 RepID=UPI0012AE7F91|nr:ATP-binding protein [Ancylomarina sp. 16SWW S1-10-2]MRT91878.1 hypothetical protein [Ancylomarina sp. 16SWW S1-10-2]
MHYLIKHIKFKNILCFTLALICSISLSLAQEQGAIHVVNYSYKDYHANEQNWATIEGDNGILYCANSDGVLEYDGFTWRLIELSNKSVVRSFAKDSSGRIYVGGNNEFGYLSANNKGELTYVSLLDKISKAPSIFSNIWNIKVLDDHVYFSSYNYIFILENNYIKIIKAVDFFAGCFSYNHQMYVHSGHEGLKKIQNDSLVDIPFGDFFKDKDIWSFKETKDHKILGFDSKNKFYTIDLSIKNVSSASDFIYQSHFEISKQLENLEVYTFTIFNDGSFGFATFSGFYHFSESGKLIQNINSKSGLLSEIIWNIYQDSLDVLWLSTDNGISKIDINSQLYYWGKSQGVSSYPTDVLRINKTLFVASLSGLQYVRNNQVVNSELVTDQCVAFLKFKNPENILRPKYLISLYDEGIIELNKNKSTNLLHINAWKMLQSKRKPSLVYVGAEDGLHILEFKDSKWHSVGKIPGINADIRNIFEDDNGVIWLGSLLKGIFKIELSKNLLKPYKITHLGLNNNLPSLKENIPFDLNGQLVFGTSKGLYRFSEKQDRFIPDSLLGIAYCNGSRTINSLGVDSVSRVWIGGKENGNAFLSVATPNTEGFYTVVNVPFAGINDAAVNLLYVEPDSTVWFGSPEGLYKFKGEIPQGPESYPCYIRKVQLKKDSVIYFGEKSFTDGDFRQNKPIIDYNLNLISFQFASPFFFSEDLTQYQTWLEGFENEWSVWSRDTKIDYLNLTEGDYKFHVRSKNIYGRISDEDVFQFTIRPPWQRTGFAYTLYGILAIVFVWLIIRINSARLKRLNRRLKETVEDRTADILQQKTEIQEQKEKLQVTNDKLVETNATKDKFFSIISHDLRSPFNSILGFSDLLNNEYDSFDDAEKIDMIRELNKSSKHAYNLLLNLLTWARAQRGRIEINKELLNLKDLVETSIAPYVINAYGKDIKIAIHISSETMISIDKNTSITIIGNLVNNAIKFTPEGGTITINYCEQGDNIELHIIDTGVGMSSEVIGKLFKIDENISTRGTNNEKGTGLGLILCKEFINKNGGEISVKSEVGKGSQFIITFPK